MSSEAPWSIWNFDGVALRPRAAFDLATVAGKYGIGTDLRAKFAQPRSVPHLRLYWSVLREVVEATDLWNSGEDLHEAIKLQLRMVRGISLITGETRYITQSIDFNSMEQGDFALFFKKSMVAIEEATGIDTDVVIREAKKKCGYREAA